MNAAQQIKDHLTLKFIRRFYPKQLTVHSGYTFFNQYVCSLGIEPTTFALLTFCSTTEPQQHVFEVSSQQWQRESQETRRSHFIFSETQYSIHLMYVGYIVAKPLI